MTDKELPKPHHLGIPSVINKTVYQCSEGVGIISGMPVSGVTTTLVTVANNYQSSGMNVVHLRINDDEVFPGIDSISMPEADSSVLEHLSGDGKPDLIVIDNVDSPDLAYIACQAAQSSFVLVGMHADSTEQAIFRFLGLSNQRITYGETTCSREMIHLSVNQKFTPGGEDSFSRQKRVLHNYSLGHFREIMKEENPDRSYAVGPRDLTVEFSVSI